MRRELARSVVLATLALGAAACGNAPAPSPTGAERDATAGVSDHQADVLALWEETGTITFEDYRLAMSDAIDCAEGSGAIVSDVWEDVVWGQRTINFSWTVSEEQADLDDGAAIDAAVHVCMAFHVGAIEALYAGNPAAIEFANRSVEELYPIYGPAIVECLDRNGVTLRDKHDPQEWFDASSDLMLSNGGAGPDCLAESGWWDATTNLG